MSDRRRRSRPRARLRSTIAIDVAAPAGRGLPPGPRHHALARLLPHYVRVTVVAGRPTDDRADDRATAAPAAPRAGDAGRLASADMGRARTAGLRFRHVAGATSGMDVTWRIEPTADGCHVSIEHDFAPRLPGFARARRSLVHATDRRPDAGHVPDAGGGRRPARCPPTSPVRPRRRTSCHDRPMDRRERRVWITGIGLITAIGSGVEAFRAGLRAARSPVRRIDRFDPSPFRSQVAAQVDDFEPLDTWTPRPPGSSTGSASSASSAGDRPSTTRASTIADAPPTRSASGSTSAAPSAGSRTPRSSTSATSSGASAR